VALLLDFKLDESYTPSKVAVRAGTTVHDLRELQAVELEEPAGWVDIPLRLPGGTCAPGQGALAAAFWRLR
jgi:anaphase-promoting complex subunit 10